MTILLVEDEILIAKEIRSQLESIGYDNTTIVHNSKDALTAFTYPFPDLVIMDIGLKNSNDDGIVTAKKMLDKIIAPIIFLSSYSDQQTLNRTKEITHSMYLVKPCSTRQLFVSIDAALTSFTKDPTFTNEANNQSPYLGPRCPLYGTNDHFFIRGNKNNYIKIMVNDILWIESTRGGIELHYGNSQKLVFSISLNSFLQQFTHSDLIRIHRSYIINKQKIISIGDKLFEVASGIETKILPCSQAYWSEMQSLFFKLKSD